jgi:hypothetical protein
VFLHYLIKVSFTALKLGRDVGGTFPV